MRPLQSVLVRYRTVARLVKTQRAYGEGAPSRARAWARVLRLLAAPRRTVLCYPSRPGSWTVLYKLCAVSGYWITTDPAARYDAAVVWDDATRSAVGPFRGEAGALNRACADISKRHVARVFRDTFGYDLGVDPTAYRGAIVKKSDENWTHDGVVVEGPVAASDVEPGFVYQKAVDNRRDDGPGFYEYRVPVFGRTIPVVYVKYRPPDAPFKEFSGAEVVDPADVLSADERAQLLAFAAALHLDYGELDVLRDRADGRVYVVDANKTPSGPRRGFEPDQRREALRRLRPAFDALLDGSAQRLQRSGSASARGFVAASGAPTGSERRRPRGTGP